jgi:hypothetical protein
LPLSSAERLRIWLLQDPHRFRTLLQHVDASNRALGLAIARDPLPFLRQIGIHATRQGQVIQITG